MLSRFLLQHPPSFLMSLLGRIKAFPANLSSRSTCSRSSCSSRVVVVVVVVVVVIVVVVRRNSVHLLAADAADANIHNQ